MIPMMNITTDSSMREAACREIVLRIAGCPIYRQKQVEIDVSWESVQQDGPRKHF